MVLSGWLRPHYAINDAQVEEKELDASKVSTAMAGLLASQKADREAQRLR